MFLIVQAADFGDGFAVGIVDAQQEDFGIARAHLQFESAEVVHVDAVVAADQLPQQQADPEAVAENGVITVGQAAEMGAGVGDAAVERCEAVAVFAVAVVGIVALPVGFGELFEPGKVLAVDMGEGEIVEFVQIVQHFGFQAALFEVGAGGLLGAQVGGNEYGIGLRGVFAQPLGEALRLGLPEFGDGDVGVAVGNESAVRGHGVGGALGVADEVDVFHIMFSFRV